MLEGPELKMTYTVSLSENEKYIVIKVNGLVNRTNAMKYTIESHKLGAEKGIHLFLVDLVNARNEESVAENYDFAYTDLREQPTINRKAKVAMLVEKNDHSHDFMETLSINSGHNVRLFRDEKSALNFLEP